jgi:hypothetical protein
VNWSATFCHDNSAYAFRSPDWKLLVKFDVSYEWYWKETPQVCDVLFFKAAD